LTPAGTAKNSETKNSDRIGTAPAGQVVITVDKLIALVINLVHTVGGEITADKIQTCIDNALKFLGVKIQFCTIGGN